MLQKIPDLIHTLTHSSPEELVHPKSPPIPAKTQSEGDQALYLAANSPSLEVVPISFCWHQYLRGIYKRHIGHQQTKCICLVFGV